MQCNSSLRQVPTLRLVTRRDC